MKPSLNRIVAFFVALGLTLGVTALPASAAVENWRLSGSIPLENSANDFHVKVLIEESFLLGAPINFANGPFGAPTTTTGSSGFTVDWGGVGTLPVTNGGPHDFGFDIKVNGPFTITEAWWTVNGVRKVDTDGSSINDGANYAQSFQRALIPEPASLALLGIALAATAVAARQRRT